MGEWSSSQQPLSTAYKELFPVVVDAQLLFIYFFVFFVFVLFLLFFL